MWGLGFRLLAGEGMDKNMETVIYYLRFEVWGSNWRLQIEGPLNWDLSGVPRWSGLVIHSMLRLKRDCRGGKTCHNAGLHTLKWGFGVIRCILLNFLRAIISLKGTVLATVLFSTAPLLLLRCFLVEALVNDEVGTWAGACTSHDTMGFPQMGSHNP